MTMRCLECGSEQAGDAGKCAGCGATAGARPAGPAALTLGKGRVRLRVDENGITVKDAYVAERVIGWDEVRWLRDGMRLSRRTRWTLEVVLKDGSVVGSEASESRTPAAAPQVLEAIRQAAADHAIPAVLTGRPAGATPSPVDKPGRYPDPGGEPGLREWTGTEWLPSLLVSPDGDGQAGPVSVVSPLTADVQRREWDAAIDAVPSRRLVAGAMFGILLAWAAFLPYPLIAIPTINRYGFWLGTSHALAAVAWSGIFLWACGLGAVMWLPVRSRRTYQKVARAARAAIARAAAEGGVADLQRREL